MVYIYVVGFFQSFFQAEQAKVFQRHSSILIKGLFLYASRCPRTGFQFLLTRAQAYTMFIHVLHDQPFISMADYVILMLC